MPSDHPKMALPPAEERIRILHYSAVWLPASETWLHNQLRFLPARIENFITCNRTANLEQFRVPNIYSLEDFSRWPLYIQKLKGMVGLGRPYGLHLPLLERVIKQAKPTILHSHFGHMGWVNAALARKYGLKHVVTFYGADVHRVPYWDPRWLTRYKEMGSLVDLVLCEGPFMADSVAALGIPRHKVKVHRLGVDLARLPFKPRTHEKGAKLRFLITGSFREKKGIPYALEALGRFSKEYEDIEITVIGAADESTSEQAEKHKILEAIKRWNLESRVRLLGEQPYNVVLTEAYRSNIFILPSLTAEDRDCEGGAPVSIIEMAASGMPIISTRHCDIPFVLSEANAPYLVNERDSEALHQAILRLLSSDWTDLLLSNRTFIERELDVLRQGEKLCQTYQDLA